MNESGPTRPLFFVLDLSWEGRHRRFLKHFLNNMRLRAEHGEAGASRIP